MNNSFIALVPKIATSEMVKHYRPISLCNVYYKIIAKILSNRLKLALHKLVSLNQNAFVPPCHIQHNLILVHEIMQTLKQKTGRGGLMAVKVVLEKAYDKVSWEFLLTVMKNFGFNVSPPFLSLFLLMAPHLDSLNLAVDCGKAILCRLSCLC